MVGVLDSGVEADLAALRDRVLPGTDELGATDGHIDCVGHGTAVAGIIAALAPGARILPVRVTELEGMAGTGTGRTRGIAGLVAAIRWTVAHGARVLNGHNPDTPGVAATEVDATPYPAGYLGVIGWARSAPTGCAPRPRQSVRSWTSWRPA